VDVTGSRIEHEEADKPAGMPLYGRCDGRFISGAAGDQRRPRHAVACQLGVPTVRVCVGRAGIVPLQRPCHGRGAAAFRKAGRVPGQQLEKTGREEMTVKVTDPHGAEAIIIGLVSDTHGLMRESVLRALAGVSLVLHAGDVGGDSVLDWLGSVAPVRAVYGNTDAPGPRLPQFVALDIGGLSIHVSHGHEAGSPTPDKLLRLYPADVIVYGHTHKALVHRAGNRLVVNPGAAGPRRFNVKPTVARLVIERGRADAEIIGI
jgi:putative phosphoesterase